MSEEKNTGSKIIFACLKGIWKLFLAFVWGSLRLIEIIAAQFAIWVKETMK